MLHLLVLNLEHCAFSDRLDEEWKDCFFLVPSPGVQRVERSAKLLGVQFPEKKKINGSISNSRKTGFGFVLFSSHLLKGFKSLRNMYKEII